MVRPIAGGLDVRSHREVERRLVAVPPSQARRQYDKDILMKLLLTSGGVSNPSIRRALADMLGKPIAESTALCIPTAMYGMLPQTAVMTWRQIAGQTSTPMVELGWKSVGMLELTALPSIDRANWVPLVREADALLVCGGDALYLDHWMRESGLVDLFPSLVDTVYVGLSAGSMVMAPCVGDTFVGWRSTRGDDRALGVVDFAIFPHLDNPLCPQNTMANATQWASRLPVPGYAVDDDTAITVIDGVVDVVSEGRWKFFER